jgi:hypothetical protein
MVADLVVVRMELNVKQTLVLRTLNSSN